MDTYGDLVTLLLTFFVLLFSFSSIDVAKWQALVGSFTGISVIAIDPISPEIAIADPIPRIGPITVSEPEQKEPDETTDPDSGEFTSNLAEIYAIIAGFIDSNAIDAEIKVFEDEFILRVVFNDFVFFETASAIVRQEAYPILDSVIEMYLEFEHLY